MTETLGDAVTRLTGYTPEQLQDLGALADETTPAFGLAVRIMDTIDPALLQALQERFNTDMMNAAQRVREQLDEGEDG